MRLAFALAALPLFAASPPAGGKAKDIPEPLKTWEEWVTWDDDHRNCPTPYHDAHKHVCFWSSRLALGVDRTVGRFNLEVTVFHETWMPLPGGGDVWPLEMKGNDVPLPVVEHDGKPSARLVAGTYRLEGSYRWNEPPQRIVLPRELGIVALTVDGKTVDLPAWDTDGFLWLKRDGPSEVADKDFLGVKVYGLLEDGIPLWLRTEIELTVSGKSREEVIGAVIPQGWKLAAVDSPIPVAVDATGQMKVQVRAGKWRVHAEAFRFDNPKEFQYAADVKRAAAEELVGFRAEPEFRTIEVVGAPAIDVSQTPFPEEWRNLPVYQWDTASPFRIEERMRGMGLQKPAGLTIARELWLDEGGRSLTFRDLIIGQMQQIWRLDAAPGQNLGSVRSGGDGQLITRNPQNGAPGVEIRTRTINLETTGRMERAKGISATGWRSDTDSLRVALNLPPGWRLFALFGADWVQGDWLTAWTLLDLFLLLIFSLAVFRLWGIRAGILAFLAFGLAYHEPGAPRYAWLVLLLPLALLRVVDAGWGRRLLVGWKWAASAALVFVLVPFLAQQIQKAIYPQLEDTRSYFGMQPADYVGLRSAAAMPMAPAASEEIDMRGTERIKEKLNSIIIPKIELREATIREAIDSLNQKSRELDTADPDPAKRGVNIVLKLDADGVSPSLREAPVQPRIPGLDQLPADASANDARITLSLTNIPLGEALKYVTGLANLKFKIEPNGVSIVSQGTPTDILITKEYKVRPGFASEPSTSLGVNAPARSDARAFLEASGVSFPPGATATYLRDSHRLVVRNTQENLDLLDTLTSATEPPDPARISNLAYDPKARIQTGPAIPDWSWRTVSFGWSGPVQAAQQVHPILISLSIERLLTILRVVLLVALSAVLLQVKGLNSAIFRRRGKVAAILLILAGVAIPARAQIPDQATLNTLRERLLKPSDAYPHAAEIPSVALSLNDRRIVIDAEIHAAIRTAVPVPGRLPAWSPLSVLVDDKPETALRRDDGFLWVVIPEGVHRLRVEGMLAEVTEWEWTFHLKPRQVTIEAPAWTFTGVRGDGVPEQQVFFVRKEKAGAGAATYERQDFQSVAVVDRHLEFGLRWEVRTTVTRLSPPGKAVPLRIPLLPGENVLSSSAIVKDGSIEIGLGAQELSFTWESGLPEAAKLQLTTRADDGWVERWHIVASPVWNLVIAGLPPIFESGNPELVPVWQPWPGENVDFTISRPEALAGATVTVNRATHEITLGKHQRVSKLDLSLRSSFGEDFSVTLPAQAEITSLTHNSEPIPVRKDLTALIIPLRPGEQSVSIGWKLNTALGVRTRAEEVRLPVESANVSTIIQVPDDRWVLWADGPRRGPAVRFWVVLVCALLAAWTLGRMALSPLRSIEWMLLVIGLTQLPLAAALIVIAWLFFLSWRGRESFQRLSATAYNGLQLVLTALTAVALGLLVYAVGEGLLGNPEMFISGNDSTRTVLRWYQPRCGALLPGPGCLSVSVWWYRLLMLAWALWLAASLIRWLRLGWQNFSRGGFLRKIAKKPAAPPPLPVSA